jgi:hypothetical protein
LVREASAEGAAGALSRMIILAGLPISVGVWMAGEGAAREESVRAERARKLVNCMMDC